MSTLVFKLFAGQGTGRTDKEATTCSPLWEHKYPMKLPRNIWRNNLGLQTYGEITLDYRHMAK